MRLYLKGRITHYLSKPVQVKLNH